MSHDAPHLKGGAATAARALADPEFRQHLAETGRRGGTATAARMQEDPEFRERRTEHLRRSAALGGAAAAAVRRRCNGCDRVSNAGGMAAHQKHSGHEGWVAL
jgi:general stress protein YciG